MPAATTPAKRLAEIRKSWPDAALLAERLALATRIEPELLRETRLALFPKSHASLEAELFFSPLVAVRTPQWLVLDQELAQEMQKRLASAMKRVKTRTEIRRVRELIERAHASVPFEIAREEEMIWLSVERPQDEARKAIGTILKNCLARLSSGTEQANQIALW